VERGGGRHCGSDVFWWLVRRIKVGVFGERWLLSDGIERWISKRRRAAISPLIALLAHAYGR
jgi:hypothetical protein